jgi:hypothetical protein
MEIQPDQQTGGDPEGKPADLDSGVEFLFSQLAKRDFPEVFKHKMEFDLNDWDAMILPKVSKMDK